MQGYMFGELRQPLVVAYGLGVDSTAVLVGMKARGVRPDLILHADTGGEKLETVAYLPVINEWLRAQGWPEVVVVRYVPQDFKHWPPYYTLEENCLTNGTLPSISFNFRFKSCSQKWKAAPQHKYLTSWAPAVEWWNAGGKVRKVIGYDAGAGDRKRLTYACNGEVEDERYEYWYPLTEWGWDRERCKAEIAAAGLPVPVKSSCYFCAAMHPEEVEALPADKLRGIVRLEARAKPRFVSITGLWGKGTKAKSGSITEYIKTRGRLPVAEIERIQQDTPGELIAYQQGYANRQPVPAFGKFLKTQMEEKVS